VIIKPVEKQEPKKPETIHVDNTSEAAGTDEQKIKEIQNLGVRQNHRRVFCSSPCCVSSG